MTTINVTNTSKNATSLKWFINGWFLSPDNTLEAQFNTPGIYEIWLVAINDSCTDTVLSTYFYPGAQPLSRNNLQGYYGVKSTEDFSTTLIAFKNGSYLMGGYSFYTGYQHPENGLLI